MQLNLKKTLATVVLTALIWVWADMALDEELPISNARLAVTKSIDPAVWVGFGADRSASVLLTKVVLRGSARRIGEVRRRIADGTFGPEFYFDPAHENMMAAGDHVLDTARFLSAADKLTELGLSAASADPNTLTVGVVELQKKVVPVRCFDESQNPVRPASIEPAQVEAYVPPDRNPGAPGVEARVVLSRREMEQARLAPVEKTPYVELAPGQTREVATSVRIAMPKEQERLQEYLVTGVRLGFSFSANLQGKYKVELVNPDVVMGTVAIRATPEAKRAYDNMGYHVILEIEDSDRDSRGAEVRRDLVYNFPAEFVRADDIVLNQTPAQARFRLAPLAPATAEPAPAPAQS